MNEEIPEETLKQWLSEFIDWDRREMTLENWSKFNLDMSGRLVGHVLKATWESFKAAKTSSYELKENLRKRGNNLSKECVELQRARKNKRNGRKT